MKSNGARHDLGREVDHEGEVPERCVTQTQGTKAALNVLNETMPRYGRPESVVAVFCGPVGRR